MSEDTYGVNTGGCLLKDDLSFSYHENFYKGKKPKYKEDNWYSCPWKYPFKKKNKIKFNRNLRLEKQDSEEEDVDGGGGKGLGG